MVQHRVDSIQNIKQQLQEKEDYKQENLDLAEMILELQYEIELLKLA